jgi:hypothetical protein
MFADRTTTNYGRSVKIPSAHAEPDTIRLDMQFRTRSAYGPRVASAAPLVMDLSPDRAFRRGEGVSLQAEGSAFQEEIRAVVIESSGRSLCVRALHDVYTSERECLIRRGDEFRVSPENVFSVHFSV